MLDIQGAFDNLHWQSRHEDLNNLGCRSSTKEITKSYLQNRRATLRYGGIQKSVVLTKGCPQGSIFGPILWNATINQLLSINFPEYVRIQAYTDDIVVSMIRNTRAQLVERATNALKTVKQWGTIRGLKFSTAIPLGCELVAGFTIPFGDGRIVTTTAAKYLGIWIDQKLTYEKHVNMIKDKNLSFFSRLRAVLGYNWGMKRENAILL